MRLYFSAPNPGGNSTRFYLDNVDLTLCTTQRAVKLSAAIEIEAPQSATALAGQTITYTHLMTNIGPGLLPHVFTVTALSSLWVPA